MARAPLTASLPPERELKAFARLGARLLLADARGPGERETPRRRRGPGHRYLDQRDYRPGDDLRFVNWLQSARLGRPIVREFSAEVHGDWLLCIDGSASMAVAGHAKWHQATHLAAGLAFLLLDLGHRVSVAVFAAGVEAACESGRGHAQYLRIARTLTGYLPPALGAPSRLGSCRSRLAGANAAIVVSDFLTDDGMQPDLAQLASGCSQMHVLALGAQAERRLPEAGPCDLIDVETRARLAVLAGARLEHRADRAAQARTSALTGFCRSTGIHASAIAAEAPWQMSLLHHLTAARAR